MKILSKIKGIDTLAEHNISDAVTLGTEQTVTGMKYFDKAYFNNIPFVDVDSRSVMLATMSDVPSITPLLDTGTEIASITLGTEKVYLYAPKASSVDLSDYYTSGEVDDKLSAYLPLSGGTVTGSLSIDGSLSTNSYLYAYGDVMGLVGATVNWRITTAGAATFTSLTVGGKSLATVATSGSYNDLSDLPTLGTAAAKSYTTSVESGSTSLVTSGAVYSKLSSYVTSSALSSASVNYATSAGSATKLSTSRTIWGQSFDGSGNVSGLIASVSGITGVVPTGGTYRRFGIVTDSNNCYFQIGTSDGTSQKGNLVLCGINGYSLNSLAIRTTTASITGGLLGIGTTSPLYKLHVVGDEKIEGTLEIGTAAESYATIDDDGNASFTSLTVGGAPLATVATSGSYNDLSDKPTIPSLTNYYTKTEINTTLADFLTTSTAEKTYLTQTDAASTYQPKGSYLTSHQTIYNLTMQAGAFSAVTFAPNGAAKTVNIPTKTSHLTNDSGFVTSSSVVAGITVNGTTKYPTSGIVDIGTIPTSYNDLSDLPTLGTAAAKSYTTSVESGSTSLVTSGAVYSKLSSYVSSSALSSASVNYATSAGSATKLSTSRTIWGQSFDGSGNVSGLIASVSGIYGVVPTGGTYRRFGIVTDSNTCYFQVGTPDGTSQIGDLMLCGINVYPLNSLTMKTTTASITGDLGIGTASPSYKLHVVGSGYFTSNVLINTTTRGGTSYYLTVNGSALCSSGSWDTASDMRLKHKLHDVRLSLDAMAEAPLVRFDWIDRRDERHHIGTYAQYWQTRLPDVVNELDNGTLVLGYSELGVAMGISLAKEMLELTTRVNNEQSEIDKLKARIGELEERIALLESA